MRPPITEQGRLQQVDPPQANLSQDSLCVSGEASKQAMLASEVQQLNVANDATVRSGQAGNANRKFSKDQTV